jgi:hypothetical protein
MGDDKKGTFFGNLLRGISGGIPGLLTSAASSIISNIGAKRRQQTADDKNIEFWKMQNQYNTPAAQMQRLKDAGLNPNLIYGSSPAGASGSAGSIAPSKPAPYAIKDPTQSIAQMQLLKAQRDNLNANTYKTQMGGDLTNEQKEILQGTKESSIEIKQLDAAILREKKLQEMYNTLELKQSFQKRVDILGELYKQNKSASVLKKLDEEFAKEEKLRPNDPYWLRLMSRLKDFIKGNDNHHSQEKANEIKRNYNQKFNR